MPQSKRDVLTLLCATEEMVTDYADRPIIDVDGRHWCHQPAVRRSIRSSMTFLVLQKGIRTGQMGVNDLNTVLDLLHCAM